MQSFARLGGVWEYPSTPDATMSRLTSPARRRQRTKPSHCLSRPCPRPIRCEPTDSRERTEPSSLPSEPWCLRADAGSSPEAYHERHAAPTARWPLQQLADEVSQYTLGVPALAHHEADAFADLDIAQVVALLAVLPVWIAQPLAATSLPFRDKHLRRGVSIQRTLGQHGCRAGTGTGRTGCDPDVVGSRRTGAHT
jgi:hypothetical protein